MELRPLGKTGMAVSPIGLGTVKLGRSEGVKYPRPFTIPDDAAAKQLLDVALALGVNVIDTAPAYGTSEERLGVLLRGSRERWVIVTKAGEEFEDGRSRFDFAPSAVRASVERSLRRFATDRVECLLLHSDGEVERHVPDELVTELTRLKHRGKARAVGISTKTPEGAIAALNWADVVMVTLNPGHHADIPAIHAARDRGVGVLVKKALASGHVGSVAVTAVAPNAGDAIAYAAAFPGVSSVIVGTVDPGHLEQNCRAAEGAIARGAGSGTIP